jgi:predicted nucleic acid-binding protein
VIVVDTSIWIEFFRGRLPNLAAFEEQLTTRAITAPSFVFGELLQGSRDERERSLLRSVAVSVEQIDETGVWLDAGDFASKHKTFARGVGLIDVAILLVSRRRRARVWTLDKNLRALLRKEERFDPAKA